MSDEHEGHEAVPQEASAGSQDPASGALSEAEKERIRSEEIHSAEERRYRDEVRREVRKEAEAGSVWSRVLAMLKLEPGISEEIASDPNATKQGLIVLVIASAATSLWMPLLIPIALLSALFGVAIAGGLYWLFSRLFSNDVPAYPNWFRMMLFATAPSALGIVPFLGTLVGAVYTIVLHVVTIRDLARVTTGAAVVTWLVAVLLPMILITAAFLTFGLAVFMQYLPEILRP